MEQTIPREQMKRVYEASRAASFLAVMNHPESQVSQTNE
jgi:hypothetical protein